jgi:DNA-binding IclR family transcriptional regulator
VHVPRGALRPIGASGTGYAILSTLTDTEVRKLAHRINAEARLGDGSTNPVETEQLLETVGEARRLGYSFTADVVTQGGALLAMPLPVNDGGQSLVIGLGGSSVAYRARREELLASMKETIATHFPPPRLPEVRRVEMGVPVPPVHLAGPSWITPLSTVA